MRRVGDCGVQSGGIAWGILFPSSGVRRSARSQFALRATRWATGGRGFDGLGLSRLGFWIGRGLGAGQGEEGQQVVVAEEFGNGGQAGAGGFLGGEFLADFGALGPLPELLFFADLGVGFIQGEPLAFEIEALGEEFGAADTRDIGAELAQAAPVGIGIVLESGEGVGGGGVLEDEPMLKLVGGELGERVLAGGVFHGMEKIEGVLADLPIAEAAVAPFG